MTAWIDFKELRAQLEFKAVLSHYGIEVKQKGSQHHGFCPLPNHKGQRNSPSFSANLERGIFQCFGCGAKGNVLDFAVLMSNVDLHDRAGFRRVAIDLQKRFCPQAATPPAKPSEKTEKPAQAQPPGNALRIINAPLDFELKGLNQAHPYLLNRGLETKTIQHFGLGVCSRGMLKERVAIPLVDAKGRLIGYAGRVIDDSSVDEDNPRYRFPAVRQRDGKTYEFRKSLFLYNGFRFKEPLDDLIVVEGFPSVWWLHQNGFPHVVATMGSSCSDRQAELIVSSVTANGHVWLLPDGDEAGTRFAQSLLPVVAPQRFVRWVRLGNDKQPTDLNQEELAAAFK